MKTKQFGNFRVNSDGTIDYYVGWCSLDYNEIEDLKKLLEYTKVYFGIPDKNENN